MICRSLPRMKKVARISSRPPSALAPSAATARSGYSEMRNADCGLRVSNPQSAIGSPSGIR